MLKNQFFQFSPWPGLTSLEDVFIVMQIPLLAFQVGVASGLLILCTFLFRAIRRRGKASWPLFAVTAACLGAKIIMMIMEVGENFRSLFLTDCENRGHGCAAPATRLTLDSVESAIGVLAILLGDGITVNVARVLYPKRAIVSTILIAMLTATFVFGIFSILPLSDKAFYPGQDAKSSRLYLVFLQLAWYLFPLSFLTNAVSTILIGLKLWTHKTYLKSMFRVNSRFSTKSERVLLLLVESGALLCLLQLWQCFATTTTLFGYWMGESMDSVHAFQILAPTVAFTVAIYPGINYALLKNQALRTEEVFTMTTMT